MPQDLVVCDEENCGARFSSTSQVDEHRRIMHQIRAEFTLPSGEKTVVFRENDQFHCPLGLKKKTKTKSLKQLGNLVMVIPDVDEALEDWTLKWNAAAKLLICDTCHIGVRPDEVHSHLKSDGLKLRVNKDTMNEALQDYAQQANIGTLPPGYVKNQPFPPVEGLKLYNGYGCKLCCQAWLTMKSLQAHFREHHSDNYPDAKSRIAQMQDVKCQTLYLHSHQHYFPVMPYIRDPIPPNQPAPSRSPSPDTILESDAVEKLLAKLNTYSTEYDVPPANTGSKDASNWLFMTGILGYFDRLNLMEKSYMDTVPANEMDKNVKVMIPHIAKWIDTTMKELHKTGQLLKRMCLAETDEMEDNKGIMPLQEKSSVFKYAGIIAMFMWHLIQQIDSPLDPELELYNVHKDLIAGLAGMIAPLVPEDSSDSDGPGPNHNKHRQQHPRRENPADLMIFPIEIHPLASQVSKILCSIFQVYTYASTNQFLFPPMQFLALSMRKDNGSFHHSSHLTRLIAAIQYATRLAFAEEFLNIKRPAFNPADDPKTPRQNNWANFIFLRQGTHCPFTSVRQLMHLASTITMSEALPETTFWADHHQETLEVNNKRVTITGIRNCIQNQLLLAERDVALITQGVKLPPFDINVYRDKPNNTDAGTNYLNHSELTHNKYRLLLLKEWVKKGDVHGLLNNDWKNGLGEDQSLLNPTLWSPRGMRKWLKMVDRLTERFYFLYHVASGQPTRGAEESTALLVNTTTAPRNVFLRSDQITITQWYHKGRNITGKKQTKDDFSASWSHSPMASLAQLHASNPSALELPDLADDMATKLWVTSTQGVLETPQFTGILKRLFNEGGVARMGVLEWRHVSVAITDAHIKVDEGVLGGNSMFDLQRGHSSETANFHYAGTGGYEIDRKSEWQYRLASHAWHVFWGVEGVLHADVVPVPKVDKRTAETKAMDGLKLYFDGNQDIRFKSAFQGDWLTMVFQRRFDMLVVARTGGGKSLAYNLPPLVEHDGVTVIIQPLTALVAETAQELKANGVNHVVYRPKAQNVEEWHRVIVCTTDAAAELEFYHILSGLPKINRIIIDEAHCYEDDDTFRSYATPVSRLRQLECPFVFMTATMQIGHERTLFNLFSIQNVIIKREPTGRPELQFAVLEKGDDLKMFRKVCNIINDKSLANRDRNILFIEHIQSCNKMMTEILKKYPDAPVTIYNSKLADDVGQANIEKWQKTPKCLMIATSGFGAGINYKHVRNVMIAGLPNDFREVNKCFQEAGRAGRDGAQATVWIFELSHPEKGSFGEKLMDRSQCIAATFSSVLDNESRSCADVGCFKACSSCWAQGVQAAHKRKDAPPAEILPGEQPMYIANVKRARKKDLLVADIGLEIVKNRQSWRGYCGWCLAKDQQLVKHSGIFCNTMGGACLRCYDHGHRVTARGNQPGCQIKPVSAVLQAHGSKDRFMCHFCGLPEKFTHDQTQDVFHEKLTDGSMATCDSGLQNLCERYCWYYFRHNLKYLREIIGILEMPYGNVSLTDASSKDIQEWLGSNGWLGCSWANMVTLFIVIQYPDLQKRL
ncbi:hypothetical protein DFH28DRAFT_1161337 [Melampsora americana]|nr:hypothetical protein DFH28DRAFT_1161337 [Melampsora americana]